MNLNFLSGLKGFGQMIGGGIKKGVGKLGEMEGANGEAAFPMLKRPMPMTPGFNPEAAMPSLKSPMMGGDSGLINRPQSMPSQMPQLQRPESPALEPIRDSVNISASNSGPVGGSDALGSMMDRMANRPAEVENQQTQMLAPRPIGQVRPPDLLGRRGDTLDDTPMGHARYGYQSQYMDDKGHIPRRWQDIAMNSLHGAAMGFQNGGGWQGALGGAAAGGVGSAIDPTRARDFRFNQEQVPRLERNRADLERGQDRSFEMQKRGADLEGARARTAATIAGTKDQDLERQYRQSQIAKMDAQAQAAADGQKKQFIEFDPETGLYFRSVMGPDGKVIRGPRAGEAELKLKGFENQKQIGESRNKAGMERVIQQGKDAYKRTQAQQDGANYRAGMSQSGQDRRTDKRINAQYGDVYTPPNRVPMGPDIPPQGKAPAVGSVPKGSTRSRFIQRAVEEGYSRAEAEAEAKKRGY